MTYKHKTKQQGFTLIELMITIAIIVVLSSIMYASLQSTRNKAANKGAQVYSANALVQAKLYYFANSQSFLNVCSAGSVNGTKSINSVILNAANETKVGTYTTISTTGAGAGDKTTCHDSKNAWTAEVPLKGSTSASPLMFCVDSTGTQINKTTNLASGATSC